MSKGQGETKVKMVIEHEKEYEINPRNKKDELDHSVSDP